MFYDYQFKPYHLYYCSKYYAHGSGVVVVMDASIVYVSYRGYPAKSMRKHGG